MSFLEQAIVFFFGLIVVGSIFALSLILAILSHLLLFLLEKIWGKKKDAQMSIKKKK